jgi:hypothetical protein
LKGRGHNNSSAICCLKIVAQNFLILWELRTPTRHFYVLPIVHINNNNNVDDIIFIVHEEKLQV